MSRKLKNIIMIIFIIVLCIAMSFTVQYFKNSNNIRNNFMQNRGQMRQERPEGEVQNGIENSEQMATPPEKTESGEGINRPISNGNQPPEMLDGEENRNRAMNNGEALEMLENMPADMRNSGNMRRQISITYYLLVGLEGLALALILVYLIMSNFNKKTFKETLKGSKEVVVYILVVVIVTALVTILSNQFLGRNQSMNGMMMPNINDEETEKETTAEDVESGKVVTSKDINLSEYTSNITITEAGEYTLTGKFNYSVLVNGNGNVKLNLDNVTIENETTAAIANISQNELSINLLKDTTNTLTDGGSSEYDGCIYSSGPLTIEGEGNVNIYGKQEEGEGIATTTNNITINGGNINIECNDDGINAGGDGGTITINNGVIFIKASGDGIDSNKDIIINGGTVYSMGSSLGGDAGIDADEGIIINGGEVIALGSDMLEKPLETSKQNSVCFSLNNSIENGTTIALKNENKETITTVEAKENFRTLIISNEKLQKGTYYLYKGEENIAQVSI